MQMTMVFFIVGSIIGVIGWVILIIAAFRESVWWGLAVLIGPIVVYFLVGGDIWMGEIGSLIIILVFVVPRWREVKTGFIIYLIGSIISLPVSIGGPAWQQQETYKGDCQRRPTGTVCLRYDDGYIWLTRAAPSSKYGGWEKRLGIKGFIHVANTADGRYEHILGTNFVRVARTKAQESAQAETQQSRGSDPDREPVKPYVPPPVEPAVPTTHTIDQKAKAPATEQLFGRAAIEQVYVLNVTKKYYPLDCKVRPDGVYKMAKSLAVRQGYELAPECAR